MRAEAVLFGDRRLAILQIHACGAQFIILEITDSTQILALRITITPRRQVVLFDAYVEIRIPPLSKFASHHIDRPSNCNTNVFEVNDYTQSHS